jgi:hypothetical protein
MEVDYHIDTTSLRNRAAAVSMLLAKASPSFPTRRSIFPGATGLSAGEFSTKQTVQMKADSQPRTAEATVMGTVVVAGELEADLSSNKANKAELDGLTQFLRELGMVEYVNDLASKGVRSTGACCMKSLLSPSSKRRPGE